MEQASLHKLDLRGAIIPFTLLKVSQVFGSIHPGDILEVLWNDPDTPTDLFKILPDDCFEMIAMELMEEKDPFYRLEIKKKPATQIV